MKKLALIIIMSISTFQLFSQTISDSLKSQLTDTSKYADAPIYVIKRRTNGSIETTNIVLNMFDVDSVNLYTAKSPGEYGKKVKTFLVEYNIKNIAPIVNFEDFCAIYQISREDQNLPFFIDSLYAYKPKQTYFELGDILSVTISFEKSSGMKYVNIITVFPQFKNTSPF